MRLNHLVLSTVILSVSAGQLSAGVYTVKKDGTGDYQAIQAALLVAQDGDTVMVYPGTYREMITFPPRSITLTGTNPDDPAIVQSTIIDGDVDQNPDTANGSVITLYTYSGSWPQPNRVIAGLTITGGNTANNAYGGGIYGNNQWATISKCRIVANKAYYGGGIGRISGGSILDCTISQNSASNGGGLYYYYGDITGCTISQNNAYYDGGGLAYCYPYYSDDEGISNCIIDRNTAGTDDYWGNSGAGGGLYRCSKVHNCVILGNKALSSSYYYYYTSLGGGLCYCSNVSGCTITQNEANSGAGAYGGDMSACIVAGNGIWYDSVPDPYTNPNTYTGGGLYSGSAKSCVISGNVAGAGGGVGNSQTIQNCTIARNQASDGSGIYNNGGSTISSSIVWYDSVSDPYSQVSMVYSDVQDGDALMGWQFGTGNIKADPKFGQSETGIWYDSAYDPYTEAGGRTTLTVADSPWQPDQWAGRIINPNTAQPLHFVVASSTANSIVVWGDASFVQPGDAWEIYDYHLPSDSPCVNTGDPNYTAASGETDVYGQSRVVSGRVDIGAAEFMPRIIFVKANAAGANDGTSWADAYTDLQTALDAAEPTDQIWVAAGSYKPAGPGGSRLASFNLMNNVAIYGGFAGTEDPLAFDINTRNFQTNATILSGDLNGDDGPSFANNGENSYHVVTASLTDSTAILDGFTIQGGNANNMAPPDGYGGGVFVSDGTPTIRNCILSSNYAISLGGGMFSQFCDNAGPTLTKCQFIANSAAVAGGAMANYMATSPDLTNCVFFGNSALQGGAIYNSEDSAPTITNCSIGGNSATSGGGGIYNRSNSDTEMVNCVLWGNTAPAGSQISLESQSTISSTYSDVLGGEAGIAQEPDCSVTWGNGNIDADPLFTNPQSGNLDIAIGSPCIDAGNGSFAPSKDILGRLRHDDEGVSNTGAGSPSYTDIGAYEFQYNSFLGTLTVDTNPCKAEVIVDGVSWGIAPQTRRVSASNYPPYDYHYIEIGPVPDMFVTLSQNWAYVQKDQTVQVTGTCYPDCNHNEWSDQDEVNALGRDCNHNGIPDDCDIANGIAPDVNGDGIMDSSVWCNGGYGALLCSLPEAISSASLDCGPWFTGPPAFVESPILTFGKPTTIHSFADIVQPAGGAMTMADGVVVVADSGGITLNGLLLMPPGIRATLQANQLTLAASGQLSAKPSSVLTLQTSSGSILTGASTVESQATLSCTGDLQIAGTLENTGGTLAGSPVSIAAPDGSLTMYGNIQGDVVNEKDVTITANTQVTGSFTNNGTTVVESGLLTINGSFTANNGVLAGYAAPASQQSSAMTSTPSDGVYITGDCVLGSASSLVMSSDMLLVRLGGSFDAQITNSENYDMSLATLQLSGNGSQARNLEVMSKNIGPVVEGLDRSLPGHFPIGVLRIGPTNGTIQLADNRDNDGLGQQAREAIYVDQLIIESGAKLNTNGCRIYYNTLRNNGTVDTPKNLIKIGTAWCPADFDANGHVDEADLEHLVDCASGPAVPHSGSLCSDADLDTDGDVDSDDFAVLQRCWTGDSMPDDPNCAN